MDTPGMELTLTVAVLGDADAPVHQLARFLAKRVRWRHGPEAVPYVNPHIVKSPQWNPTGPLWALLRLPSRLVALASMSANATNRHDVAWGLGQADAALLVVSASREAVSGVGRVALLRDLALLSVYRGLDQVLVFLDTANAAAGGVDDTERGLRLTLMMAGLPGDDLTVIRGTVNDETGRPMDEALDAVARDFRAPAWDAEGPLLMIVRAVGPDGARGRITSGRLARGQAVIRVQRGSRVTRRVQDLRRFGHPLDEAAAGQNVAVALEPAEGEPTYHQGAVIADMDGVKVAASFTARVTFFRTEDGGRGRHVMSGFVPTFLLPSVHRKARIELLDRLRAYPGETFPVRAKFPDGYAEYVCPGDPFILRRDGRIIGHGVVE